jgi:hypothetical protein
MIPLSRHFSGRRERFSRLAAPQTRTKKEKGGRVKLCDLEFKDADGRSVINAAGEVKRMISIDDANRLLGERLSAAHKVFGRHDAGGGCNVWDGRRMPWDLYQARLVCVEAVPPKEPA